MHRLLTLLLLFPFIACGSPLLEVYDIAPRKAHEELRLVLKLTNTDEKDLYVLSEGITEIPFFVRFRQKEEDFDLPSHDCGTNARPHRLRPKTYALIEVHIMRDILVSTPVSIRSKLFSDPSCRDAVWTNELKFTPEDFKEKQTPNQSPEPTPLRVTPAADAPVAPRSVAAHL